MRERQRATVKDRQKARQTDKAEIAKGKRAQHNARAIFIAKQGVHKMCRMHMEDSRMKPNICTYIWGNTLFRKWCGISRMSHNKNYARMWLTMCTKDKAQSIETETETETQNGNSSKK